jgi:hypothetical protein
MGQASGPSYSRAYRPATNSKRKRIGSSTDPRRCRTHRVFHSIEVLSGRRCLPCQITVASRESECCASANEEKTYSLFFLFLSFFCLATDVSMALTEHSANTFDVHHKFCFYSISFQQSKGLLQKREREEDKQTGHTELGGLRTRERRNECSLLLLSLLLLRMN